MYNVSVHVHVCILVCDLPNSGGTMLIWFPWRWRVVSLTQASRVVGTSAMSLSRRMSWGDEETTHKCVHCTYMYHKCTCNYTYSTQSVPHEPHFVHCSHVYAYVHTNVRTFVCVSQPDCEAMFKFALEKCEWQHNVKVQTCSRSCKRVWECFASYPCKLHIEDVFTKAMWCLLHELYVLAKPRDHFTTLFWQVP